MKGVPSCLNVGRSDAGTMRGRTGRDRHGRYSLPGFLINILMAFGVLLTVFHGLAVGGELKSGTLVAASLSGQAARGSGSNAATIVTQGAGNSMTTATQGQGQTTQTAGNTTIAATQGQGQATQGAGNAGAAGNQANLNDIDQANFQSAQQLIDEGRDTFRFDTFGDEEFWGGKLKLHQAVGGANAGGSGDGLTPTAALDLGLKVDSDALPSSLVDQLKSGQVDLNDPATTLTLLKMDAVVGVKGFFGTNGSTLQSVGITCALCHSTVDDSVMPGVGRRLDGWANRDLDVGAIIALAPDLSPFVDLLKVVDSTTTAQDVRTVLNAWGPGKFDAQLTLDGKGFRPDGKTAATLIPNACDLAGFNLHTWTNFGNVTYWNAFVATLEMHGKGNFFDPRLDDITQFPEAATKFPIAVAKQLGHIKVDPGEDRITKKLPGLHLYQLSLPSPTPVAGEDFDADAAARGEDLFNGKAGCNSCHIPPLWTEPGWNAHTPDEMKIDSFQADRSPDGVYKTANLSGLFVRELGRFMKPDNKGRFYHDGRFATLSDAVESYNTRFDLGLSSRERDDLVEYLKSL
ncbi:MAG: hypothetical protein K8I29_10585 [Alphaproteobacteria bacterium]|uniref:Cytochrome c domain-containing protein n=1 Tax=Candidatus Nitrobium versatile TaxID=2884831 RepID=A0A953JB08_9BACT|nr:hypothetical protein [Candidatus Nitrobium versatile]